MKLRQLVFSRVGIVVCCAVALGAGVLVSQFVRSKPVPHVQVVLASDGAVMVAGVPGRSMRSQVQNHAFWNGQSTTSSQLAEFLSVARHTEERAGTFDGRVLLIVDDHASFQILKMLVASARTSYPEVTYMNGPVVELPRRGPGADKSFIKDCSARPPPPGCASK